MSDSVDASGGIGRIVVERLRRSIRRPAGWIALGAVAVLLVVVAFFATVIAGSSPTGGGAVFSMVTWVTLGFAAVLAPVFAGSALNGRSPASSWVSSPASSSPATTTPDATPDARPGTSALVVGSWLAAWIGSLSLVVVALPLLLISAGFGRLSPVTVIVTLAMLAAESAVFTALAVGLSGVFRRPVASILTTYLVLAVLSLGTPIALLIAGSASSQPLVTIEIDAERDASGEPIGCLPPVTKTSPDDTVAHYESVWWLVVANPFVMVSDAAAGDVDGDGRPATLLGDAAQSYRSAQEPPQPDMSIEECSDGGSAAILLEEPADPGNPTWFWGLGVQVLLGAAALVGGRAALRRRGRGPGAPDA
jgi:ABC-2 type transport system permease protein